MSLSSRPLFRVCPSCRTLISPDATVCRHCTRDVTPMSDSPQMPRRKRRWPWVLAGLFIFGSLAAGIGDGATGPHYDNGPACRELGPFLEQGSKGTLTFGEQRDYALRISNEADGGSPELQAAATRLLAATTDTGADGVEFAAALDALATVCTSQTP